LSIQRRITYPIRTTPQKIPESVSQARISKKRGHENGQKDPEGWKADDIAQEANHQGADRDQHENSESCLKLFRQAKQRPGGRAIDLKRMIRSKVHAPLGDDLLVQDQRISETSPWRVRYDRISPGH